MEHLNDSPVEAPTPKLFNRAELQLALDFNAAMRHLESLGFGQEVRRAFAMGVKIGIESITQMRENPEVMELYADPPHKGGKSAHFGAAVAAYVDAASSVVNAN